MLKCFLKKLIKTMKVEFLILTLNLGKAESDENDDSNFEIFPQFEVAIAAE